MTRSVIAANLQIRRLVWLLKDLRRSLSGLRQALRYARESDQSVGLGLLEGGAWASQGQVNVYRIRIVNDSPDARDVELLLRGERVGGKASEVRHHQQVPAKTVAELFLLTNWQEYFEVASDAPPADPCTFLAGPSTAGWCRVAATLSAGGERLDDLTVTQELVE
jgi:hypothetical protein